MTTIAWLAQIYVTQSTEVTGALDSLAMESPLVPIDTVYVAVVGGLLLMGFILREWKRQHAEGRALMGGPPRDRPGFSPSAMRYLRTFEVDAKAVVAALVRLAAKGRITVRLVGDGIDVTRLENPPEIELAPDEKLVCDKFLGDRDYMDVTNLWGEVCSATLEALEFHYQEVYGRHCKEPNKPFVHHVAFGFVGFLFALSLTTKNPIQTIIVPLIMGFCLWAVVFMMKETFKDHGKAFRYRPSLWQLVRSPSLDGLRSLWSFLREIGLGLQQFLVAGFCFLFMSLISLVLLSAVFGFESALILIGVLSASVIAILRLRHRRTPQGAEALAAIEHYAHGFDAATAEDETGGWADALALGYLDSVGDADDLSEEKEIRVLNEQVPNWFSKSQDDAQAFELAQVLAERVPRAFNDAMIVYK